MYIVRNTLKLKHGEIVSNEYELATKDEAFDYYREACTKWKELLKQDEIDNYMVELIPPKSLAGIIEYRLTIGKE